MANCAVAGYARSQARTPVSFGPTDLVCCRTLQGHTGKVFICICLQAFCFFCVLLFGTFILLKVKSRFIKRNVPKLGNCVGSPGRIGIYLEIENYVKVRATILAHNMKV